MTQQAVDIRRMLVEAMPDPYRPGLAAALLNLGGQYLQAGRPEDALPVAEEAVNSYRELADEIPGLYRLCLAGA